MIDRLNFTKARKGLKRKRHDEEEITIQSKAESTVLKRKRRDEGESTTQVKAPSIVQDKEEGTIQDNGEGTIQDNSESTIQDSNESATQDNLSKLEGGKGYVAGVIREGIHEISLLLGEATMQLPADDIGQYVKTLWQLAEALLALEGETAR